MSALGILLACPLERGDIYALDLDRKQLLGRFPYMFGLDGGTSRTYSLRNIHVSQVYVAC